MVEGESNSEEGKGTRSRVQKRKLLRISAIDRKLPKKEKRERRESSQAYHVADERGEERGTQLGTQAKKEGRDPCSFLQGGQASPKRVKVSLGTSR